uniref:Vacuolar protein-sorting-associated protein 25 n=1 Tax=Aegilops tauschii subsp. strangulata TaxID=200361 RepID=A0A453F5N1_AEGTS
MQRTVDFKLPHFFNYPPYFTLQPVRETREKQVQLWKELILDYCRSQKMYIISLEEDFPLFSNPKIERSLSYEAKEVFLAALVSEEGAQSGLTKVTRSVSFFGCGFKIGLTTY